MKVVWLDSARTDLEMIYEYLAPRSRKAAVKLYNKLYDGAGSLGHNPLLGKVETSLGAEFAEYRALVIARRYKIIYKTDGPHIYIAAIWDCRRAPGRFFHYPVPPAGKR
jgi:plasmid stabilization system protein ParE